MQKQILLEYEEAQDDLRKNEKRTIKMDFFIRDKDFLIPVEVKANDNATVSLNNLINSDLYKDIK